MEGAADKAEAQRLADAVLAPGRALADVPWYSENEYREISLTKLLEAMGMHTATGGAQGGAKAGQGEEKKEEKEEEKDGKKRDPAHEVGYANIVSCGCRAILENFAEMLQAGVVL